MSRRRSSDPALPVSIAIPRSLFTRLNELLSWQSSRSKWVCSAIKAKLDGLVDESQVIRNLSNESLVKLMLHRKIISFGLAETLMDVISNLPTEETVTEQ